MNSKIIQDILISGCDQNGILEQTTVLEHASIYSRIYNERWIDPEANPRCKQKIKKPILRLYHFTYPCYVKSILRQGISRGDVPVAKRILPTERCFNNAAWFTAVPFPQLQKWSNLDQGGAAFRVTVEFDLHDYNLWHWRDLARFLEIDPAWYKALNHSGFADKWYVYCNEPVLPSRFKEVVCTRPEAANVPHPIFGSEGRNEL